MKKTLIRLVMLIGFLVVTPCAGFAQSASESYNEGIALMNKGDYNGAIAKFKASMVINKSAANKKKCNAQIAKCNRLKKSGRGVEEAHKVSSKVLTLATHGLDFEYSEENLKLVGVETTPESDDWTATLDPENSKEWIGLAKTMDGKNLQVNCLPFNNTIARFAKIHVIYGDKREIINVRQKGKEVVLEANPFVTLSKKRGGKQAIVINCNSDTVYSDKRNWELTKTPDWCTVLPTGDKQIVVEAEKLTKSDAEYKTGRTGDIIIRSQNKEIIIRVDQK